MGKSKKKNKILKCFYGIPHCHTAFSTGRGTPNDAYEYGKNTEIDFMIITDHNSYLSKDLYWNNKEISKWNVTIAMAERFAKKMIHSYQWLVLRQKLLYMVILI